MQNNVYKQAAPAVLPLKKTWQGLCPFVQGDIVESRSFDEGFRDAWFLSKVLDVKQVKGPPAYELTLQCLDFDEDEPFQCPLYQTNPGLFSPEWELMVRPVPPGFHLPGSAKQEHGFCPRQGLRCQLRRSYAIGDAVEYLYNFAWWSGRISEISGDRASVWWRPPPFGEGGEEVNISFEELRPAMTWNQGQWCFPGHPQGPLGVLVTRNRVGRPSNPDSKPEATGTTPEAVLGKRKAGKRELVSQTRYGRMVKPKSEAQEGAEGELETPRKPRIPTGVRDGNLETAKKRKRERVPFRRGSVNESLSPEERMEVARKALQEDACSPDIGRLEEAVRTVLGCGLPSFMKKGVQFRHARFRLMLARCAETGRACPDRAHTDSVFARGRAAGHALGMEHPSSVKGSSPPPEKGDVSGAAAGSVHGAPESSPLQAKPVFKGAIKVTPKRGAKVDGTGRADSGGPGTSREKREMASAVLGGQEIRDHNAELEGDLLGELMRCFQANDHASSVGVSSKPLPVASFTPLNVVPSEAPEGQNEAGVLRLWDVAELGGMLLDSFDPP